MISFKWDAEVAKEVWKEEAMEKGMKQGLEKGMEKGIEKGMEKGMEKATEKTAIEMLRDKMDWKLIAKYTSLSLQRIAELSKML